MRPMPHRPLYSSGAGWHWKCFMLHSVHEWILTSSGWHINSGGGRGASVLPSLCPFFLSSSSSSYYHFRWPIGACLSHPPGGHTGLTNIKGQQKEIKGPDQQQQQPQLPPPPQQQLSLSFMITTFSLPYQYDTSNPICTEHATHAYDEVVQTQQQRWTQRSNSL